MTVFEYRREREFWNMSRGLEWMDEGTCQTLRAANARGLGGIKNDWCLRKGKEYMEGSGWSKQDREQ